MKTRRLVIAALLFGLTFDKTLAADAEPGPTVDFEFRAPPDFQNDLERQLKTKGAVIVDESNKGGPILVVVGAIAVIYLANAVIDLRERLTRPGIKIDTRGPKILVSIDSNLPKGTILIVDKSGAKLYERDAIKGAPELVEKLLKK